MDTAVAAYLLDPSNDRYRLADLAAAHLGVAVDDGAAGKGQGAFVLEETGDEEGRAAGRRSTRGGPGAVRLAAVVARLACALEAALGRGGRRGLHDEIDRPLVRVLARMEVVGIPVDREVLRGIAAELTAECESLEATMHELAGEPFNVNSVKQLRTVLYETSGSRRGARPRRATRPTPGPSSRCAASTRSSRCCCATGKWRSCGPPTARAWPPRWPPTGGSTPPSARRWPGPGGCRRTGPTCTTSRCAPTRAGGSARRSCPSAGRRLLVADYDQVELRAIAHLSGDPGLTAAFAAGEDIHRTVAARVFGVDRDAVTHEQRSTAKMVSYGLAYGMEAYGLAQRLGVPVEEAKGILDAFFDAFPSVHAYMDQAVAEARANGLHGHRLRPAAARCPTCSRPTTRSARPPSARP